MFYLSLRRDLKKISLARKYILSGHELSEAEDTFNTIVEIASDRVRSLRGG